MSVATEISRIQTNRNTIRTKLVELGMASNTSNLDALAAAIEGIVNRGAVSVEILEGTTYTIPAGYHDGRGTVKAMTDTTGEAETYKTQTKTITPTKNKQNISPDTGYYALESVTVNAIPENYQDVSSVTAAAGDVLTGKVYVTANGTIVTGNMVNNGAVSKALDVTTISYTIPKGYHSGSGKVTITLEEKTVTPSKSTQTITPASGKVLSKVTVNPIPAAYQDITGVTATADKVLEGSSFIDAGGNKVDGTMTNVGDVTQTLDTTTTSYTIPAGYHNGEGKVSITLQSRIATPDKYGETIKPGAGQVISQIKINPIPAKYQDVTGVTATADKVLAGSKFVDSTGEVVDGTIVDHSIEGSVHTINVENDQYFIPAGYYDGRAYVDVSSSSRTVTPTKSKQTITGESNSFLHSVTVNAIPDAYQDITGVTATAADVLSGKKIIGADGNEATGTMPNNGAVSETIAPIKGDMVQYDIPRGYHNGSGKIMIESIPDTYCDISNVTATAETVLDGKVFVNAYGEELTGAMLNNGAVTKTLNTSTTSYTIPAGYHNGSGKVSITTETKSATPTKSAQTIKPTSGKVLSSVSVAAIPAAYQDVTGVTATAATVLTGYKFVDKNGTAVNGSMANNGAMNKSIDGLTTTSATIPAGYTTGGTVSLTDDIENALKAI